MAIHGGVYLTLSVLGLPAAASAFLVVPPLPSPAGPATRPWLYRDGGSFVGREEGEGHDSAPRGTAADGGGEGDASGATLGDIMAGPLVPTTTTESERRIPPGDGLVTRDGGDIALRFPGLGLRPMERVALTANGNLQRVLSSYYDRHVTVTVDGCTRRGGAAGTGEAGGEAGASPAARAALGRFDRRVAGDEGEGATWDRTASIRVSGRTVCRASSVITVHSPECAVLIEEGSVGLGQLFRHLDRLPTFRLLDAGRSDGGDGAGGEERDHGFGGGMWRTYELRCEEVTCLIHEEFHEDTWNL